MIQVTNCFRGQWNLLRLKTSMWRAPCSRSRPGNGLAGPHRGPVPANEQTEVLVLRYWSELSEERNYGRTVCASR